MPFSRVYTGCVWVGTPQVTPTINMNVTYVVTFKARRIFGNANESIFQISMSLGKKLGPLKQ